MSIILHNLTIHVSLRDAKKWAIPERGRTLPTTGYLGEPIPNQVLHFWEESAIIIMLVRPQGWAFCLSRIAGRHAKTITGPGRRSYSYHGAMV